jgi:hypothetical protein
MAWQTTSDPHRRMWSQGMLARKRDNDLIPSGKILNLPYDELQFYLDSSNFDISPEMLESMVLSIRNHYSDFSNGSDILTRKNQHTILNISRNYNCNTNVFKAILVHSNFFNMWDYDLFNFFAPKRTDYMTRIYEAFDEGSIVATEAVKNVFMTFENGRLISPDLAQHFMEWYDGNHNLDFKLSEVPVNLIPDMLG